jgi:AraC-like DNA-binding protein
MEKINTTAAKSKNLHSLLQQAPKRSYLVSRSIVQTNKRDIVKALRRGHRIEDIAKELCLPVRTLLRRFQEANISARAIRKQYKRLAQIPSKKGTE